MSEPVSPAPAWSNSYADTAAAPVSAVAEEVEDSAPATSSIPQVQATPNRGGSLWGDDLDIPDFLR